MKQHFEPARIRDLVDGKHGLIVYCDDCRISRTFEAVDLPLAPQ